MTNAVTTTDLVKKYGSTRALNGLTISIPNYAVTGLVGANGAGKTTWMMSVAGFLRTNSGQINLLNSGPFKPEIHCGRISILPQDSALPEESYPLETLVHYARLQGLGKSAALKTAKDILTEVHLADRMSSTIRSLSHGMRKRVMIAQCFIGFPELILLDEPLSGLDPKEVANMRNFILKRGKAQTIVISSHNLNDIELLCDYVAFFKQGKSASLTTVAEITNKSGLLTYALTGSPGSMKALGALLPECTFTLNQRSNELSCLFKPSLMPAAKLNATLIPHLLQSTEIITITSGATLENQIMSEF
ncbi:MAG: ABC transporter ATP-binding protein [Kiritimatiellia bacterium]